MFPARASFDPGPPNQILSRALMFDCRQEPRVVSNPEVQITALSEDGTPFTQTAIAKNISVGGALLNGLGRKLRCGDLIRVQYGEIGARFRIVWIGGNGRIGPYSAAVQKLKEEPCPWPELLIASVTK
jgi:hypothetical protein